MSEVSRGDSPRALARVTGVFYFCIMVAAMFAEAFVKDKIIVSGNVAATARNIISSEDLWRWGLVADVFTMVCDVAVAALLFALLRPVNLVLSVGAAAFRVAYSAALAVNVAFLAAPLLLLRDTIGRSAWDSSQVYTLVTYSLRLHASSFDVALVLFGIHLVLVGGLIARSTFLPRWLGAALGIAGVCYIANSLTRFLAPTLAAGLFPWILLPGFLAEAALTLWLVIVGVNPERWIASSKETEAR